MHQEPVPPAGSARAGGALHRRASLWLGLASLLLLAILFVTQARNAARWLDLAQATKLMRAALLVRAETGDLPLGPGVPGIYALGRAAGDDRSAGAVRSIETDRALRAAADRLSALSGGQRLAGIALGSLGQYVAAQQQLQPAAAGDPFAALALGNVLDQQGQLEAALAAWRPFGLAGALSEQLYRAGTTVANQGRRPQAETMLLRAVELNPANANALHALGGFYWAQDRAKSLEMYQAALAAGTLEPFFERFAAGRVAFLEGRLEEAAAALEEAVRLRPDHGDATVLLGTTLSRLGRLPEAISVLEDAAQQSPRAFWPLVELGQIYLDLGDYEQAIETLTAAAGRRADVDRTFELLAEAYEGAGRPAQALNAWQQAVAVSPDNPAFHVKLGDVLRELGRTEEAIAAYRQALRLNPKNRAALDELLILGVEP